MMMEERSKKKSLYKSLLYNVIHKGEGEKSLWNNCGKN